MKAVVLSAVFLFVSATATADRKSYSYSYGYRSFETESRYEVMRLPGLPFDGLEPGERFERVDVFSVVRHGGHHLTSTLVARVDLPRVDEKAGRTTFAYPSATWR